ncbi:MAG TPA: hypothetical protein VKV15_28050 [Bryobacteraceae bacterium]|nr:hypothetical protein [Bryobacteraceae bacterium]
MRAGPCALLIAIFAFFAPGLYAVPILRLTNTIVGPVSVAVGANAPTQTLEAYDAGDGALNLNLSVSAPAAGWLRPSVGVARHCATRTGQCWPLSFAFETSKLPRGSYTGTVTVNDAQAADAPQTVSVTVFVGGAVPDKVDLFVAPRKSRNFTLTANGAKDIKTFTTNGPMAVKFASQSGGEWLQISLDGAGSYRFPYPWRITATYQEGMTDQTYRGTVTTANSSLPDDNKTIPVALHVTSQPIAAAKPASVEMRLAVGSPKQTQTIQVLNRGQGDLVVTRAASDVSCVPAPSGAEVIVENNRSEVSVTVDPAHAKPSFCHGKILFGTNAVNALEAPFTYQIVAQGPPVIRFQGVTENVTSDPEVSLAQGGMARVVGEQFAFGPPVESKGAPVPSMLGGLRVLVNDKPAPVFSRAYGEADFQVPFDTPPGEALVRVERDGQLSNAVTAQVDAVSRRILRLGIGQYGMMVNQDGSYPVPKALENKLGASKRGHPAHPGDILTIYAMGLGATTPPVLAGAAPPSSGPPARVNAGFQVYFGNRLFSVAIPVDPISAVMAPGAVGLYKITVKIPDHAAPGDQTHLFLYSDNILSNQVVLAIEPPK